MSATATLAALYLAWDANNIAREAIESQKSDNLRRSADRVSFTSKREGKTVKIAVTNLSTDLMFDPQLEVLDKSGRVSIVRLRDLEACKRSHFRVDGGWWNVTNASLVVADGRGANWSRSERKEVEPRDQVNRKLPVNEPSFAINKTFVSRGQNVIDRYRDPIELSVVCA